MPRSLRIVLSGFAFLVFYAVASVVAWVSLPLLRRRIQHLSPADQRIELDEFFRRVYRLSIDFMALLGLLTYELPELPEALRRMPKVVVANHPSLLDVLFIKAAIPGVVVLVKAELFRAPSLRRLFEANGDFPGPAAGDQRFGQTSVLDTFVERLRAGRTVLVFPEGTRSPAWRMHRFRRGAIEAAAQAGVPVLPVFIANDPPTLKKGDRWYDMPSRVPHFRLDLLPVVEVVGRDLKAVNAAIRDDLAARLEAERLAAAARFRERS